MKSALLIIALIGVSQPALAFGPQNSNSDSSISELERTLICKAIDDSTNVQLPTNDIVGEGWANCVDLATFIRIDEYIGVSMSLSRGKTLSCRGLVAALDSSRPYVVELSCRTMNRK